MEYPIAFTQTCPRNNLTIKEQYKEYLPELESALATIGNYIIYPELTLNNTIHFHGKLKVNDKYQYHKQQQRLKKRLGFNNFKFIDNVPKWDEYIKKDQKLMEKLLNTSLPITDVIKIPKEGAGRGEGTDSDDTDLKQPQKKIPI